MKTFESTEHFGNTILKITTEVYDGKHGDTKVDIGSEGNENLCWISGEQKDEFVKKLQDLVSEYKI